MGGMSHNIAIIEYSPLNVDWVFHKGEGREYQKRRRACDKAYDKFRNLRGSILGKAVAVERRLDSAISGYFCPPHRSHKDRLRASATKLRSKMDEDVWNKVEGMCISLVDDLTKESAIRRERMIDIVLGQEGCSFGSKTEMLKSIMDAVKTTRPSKTAVNNALHEVMKRRNQFAHRKVGVDWLTQSVSLWNARAGKWEEVSTAEETIYKDSCRKALDLVDEVNRSIWDTRKWSFTDDD
jgi:hypothetical protein